MKKLLSHLSDTQLIQTLTALVTRERETTLEILEHLAELEERKLHLSLGYPSLFAYCRKVLRYSESGAARRIKAARCIRSFPELRPLLSAGQISLSIICLIAPVLTAENKDLLLPRVINKSQEEVEFVVARYRPARSQPCESMKPIVLRKSASNDEGFVLPLFSQNTTNGNNEESYCRSGSNFSNENEELKNDEIAEERVEFKFSGSMAFTAKVKKMQKLLSHKLPKGASLEQIFDAAMDCYLEKHSPEQKAERAAKRKAAKPKTQGTSASRRIPSDVRWEVFKRDGGQCTYVGTDGHRCRSKWDVEIDHITPFAMGGTNTIDNLRLLCSQHNQLEAERHYGKEWMNSCRAEVRELLSAFS